MPQVTCPSCNQALNLPDQMVGKHVRCPLCNNTFHATGQSGPEPAGEPAPARYAPPRDRDDPYEYDRPPARPPARRDYDDYGEGEYRRSDGPINVGRRTSAAIWMIVAGVADLMVLIAFYVFIFTVDRRPPPGEAIFFISLLALVIYVIPVVFFFVAAGVMRNPRANGLIITGSVMAFIIALELLFVAGIFAIGLAVTLSDPWDRQRMPGAVPVVFFLSLIGLALTITAGVKGLLAISASSHRPRSDYY